MTIYGASVSCSLSKSSDICKKCSILAVHPTKFTLIILVKGADLANVKRYMKSKKSCFCHEATIPWLFEMAIHSVHLSRFCETLGCCMCNSSAISCFLGFVAQES